MGLKTTRARAFIRIKGTREVGRGHEEFISMHVDNALTLRFKCYFEVEVITAQHIIVMEIKIPRVANSDVRIFSRNQVKVHRTELIFVISHYLVILFHYYTNARFLRAVRHVPFYYKNRRTRATYLIIFKRRKGI